MPATQVKAKKKRPAPKGPIGPFPPSAYKTAIRENPHEQTDEFKRLQHENLHDVTIRKARWASLKEEWLERNLTGRMVHWPTLAPKYGIRAQTGMQKCADQKWNEEIEERRKAREDILDERLTQRHIAVIEKMEQDFCTSEEAIRKRHLVFARSLQDKAMEGIRTRALKDFKPSDLIRLLELGIIEERRAMGMKETAEIPAPPDEVEATREGYKPIFEQIGGHSKVQQIGTILLQELQRTGGVIDVTARQAQSVQPVATEAADTPVYEPVPEARAKPKFTVRVGPKAS